MDVVRSLFENDNGPRQGFPEEEPNLTTKILEKAAAGEGIAMSLLTLQNDDANNNKPIESSREPSPFIQSIVSDIFGDNWENLSVKLSHWQRMELEPFVQQNSTKGAICLLQGWLEDEPQLETGTYCHALWDKSVCWPVTPRGDSVSMNCTKMLEAMGKFQYFDRDGFDPETESVMRDCEPDGIWMDIQNFTECLDNYHLFMFAQSAYKIFPITVLVGSFLSCLCLSVALSVYWYLREALQSDRVTLHCHLMGTLLLRCITLSTVAILKLYQVQQATFCKLASTFDMYIATSTITWTFVQGFYLHSRVTTDIFNTEDNLVSCYLMGWFFPLLLVFIYDIASTNPNPCWFSEYGQPLLQDYSPELRIFAMTMLAILAVNMLLLLNIFRIMLSRENRNRDTEGNQFCAAVKAILALCPLQSLYYLDIVLDPVGIPRYVLVLFIALTISTQGILVANVFFFCSANVQDVIVRYYKRYQARNMRNCRGRPRKMLTDQDQELQQTQNIPLLEKKLATPPTMVLEEAEAVVETCLDDDDYDIYAGSSSESGGSPKPGPSRPAPMSSSGSCSSSGSKQHSDLAVECGSLEYDSD